MKQPLVSVIIPTKNSADTLAACLQSVKQQDYPRVEIVVVDNFSADNTAQIARQFTNKVYLHGPERSAQRNFGAQQANGEFVLIIDSDMELEPHVVRHCVATRAQVVIVPEQSFGQGFWAQCKRLERSFYTGVDWIEAARFFDRHLYLSLGGYNEAMTSGEDWDLSSRAAQQEPMARIDAKIHHNEGRLKLLKTLGKKFYYAGQFTNYTTATKDQPAAHGSQPTSIVLKRFGLFLARPAQLLRQPHVGAGMLFMKICEFGFGALGYVLAKYVKGSNGRI